MAALVFMPNLGKQPVEDGVRVSVTLTNRGMLEGEARLFNWAHVGNKGIEGWREMLPSEVLHAEHRPNGCSVHNNAMEA
jgi:hypothetical protein